MTIKLYPLDTNQVNLLFRVLDNQLKTSGLHGAADIVGMASYLQGIAEDQGTESQGTESQGTGLEDGAQLQLEN